MSHINLANSVPTFDGIAFCPFCGYFGVLHSDVSHNLPAHSIQCMSCGAEGSVESSVEGAVKRWNTRTVPAKETN